MAVDQWYDFHEFGCHLGNVGSMLNSLKGFASGWVAQLLIGLMIISFAVWGIADIFSGFGAGAVASVGKSEVTVREFQRRYSDSLRLLQRQTGAPISPQQAAQFGIPSQVLTVLLAEATLDEASSEMGLGVSNDIVSGLIRSDPGFISPGGDFSLPALTQWVRERGMTVDEFVEDQRQVYTRNQITNAFAGGLEVPDVYLRAFQELRNEERSISYVVVAPEPMARIAAPTDAQLTPFFKDRAAEWRAPEYRALRQFVISLEILARPADVTEEEARNRYDGHIARFSSPERRRIEQIVFDSSAEAGAAAPALTSGSSTFGEVARDRNLSEADIQYGLFAESETPDPAIGKAAFSLQADDTSGIVEGRFGPAIVRVTEIVAAVTRPFDEVAGELRSELAAEVAAAEIDDLHDTIEDARAGGSTVSDVAAQFGFEVRTVAAIDRAGNDEFGNAVELRSGLVEAVFNSDVGLENDPLRIDGNTFIWYEVTAVTAPRDRLLSEVRDQVTSAWRDAEREQGAVATADIIVERIESGESLSAVAADFGLAVRSADGITRSAPPPGDLTTAAASATFDGPRGHVAAVAGTDPLSRLVLTVDRVTPAAFSSGAPDLAPVERQLSRQISLDLMQLYVSEAQGSRDVRFNQAALDQLFSGSPARRRR